MLTMWFFFSLLSEFGPDAFMADDQNSETSGSESFAISRERSISAPDVYRSRIISGHTPLVSAYVYLAVEQVLLLIFNDYC